MRFTTAADQELCRIATQRATHRYVIAMNGIIALHRSQRRGVEDAPCMVCREQWPCRTVQLAATMHQPVAKS